MKLLTTIIGAILLNNFAFATANSITPSKPSLSVGVIQIIEHPALNQTRKGLKDKLEAKTNLKFYWDTAQGKFDLARQIAQKYVAKQVNVIVAIGTLAAQAALSTKSDIPIVFSSVTDPVKARLVKSLERPGGRATGVSNFVAVERQLDFIRKVMGTDKPLKIGVVYNPGEDNSHTLNQAMQAAAKAKNIKIVLSAAIRTCEVQSAANRLMGKVDAILINNDNTALAAFASIAKVCAGKIPAFVSDVDIVDQGAAGAIGANQYILGQQTADCVLKLVNGMKAAEIPVAFPSKIDERLNEKILKSLGLA